MSVPGPIATAVATAAKVGSTVACTVAGVATTVQAARDLTVAAGDVLVVNKVAGRWFAVGRAYTAAPGYVDPGDPPPPTAITPASGRLVIAPQHTGTYRDSRWLTGVQSVEQGIYGGAGNATGVAYYGYKAQSLSGATATAATVQITRAAGGAAGAATLWLVTEPVFDGAAPTRTSSTAGPSLTVGETTTYAIPAAWAQAFANGTSGALAVFAAGGTPFQRFTGRAESATAWLLTIDWTR